MDNNYRLQETQILHRRNKMVTVVGHHIHCNSSAQTQVNSKLKSLKCIAMILSLHQKLI